MTPGLSLSMKSSSSMSWGPKVQFLLVGKEISLALSVTGAERRQCRGKPSFEKCVSKKNAFHLGATCQEHLKDTADAKRSGGKPVHL